MLTLKIPSQEFLVGALKAGEKAGFEGAVVLLARKLPEAQEEQFRQLWHDIDDMTHNDILVLTTGVETTRKIIVVEEIQRHVYADGVGVAKNYSSSFEAAFKNLLKLTSDFQQKDLNEVDGRLISAQGITEIRRALEISESDIPALLVVAYRQKKEFLIKLSSHSGMVSIYDFIVDIVKNLNDIPFRHKEAKNKIEENKRQKNHYPSTAAEEYYHNNHRQIRDRLNSSRDVITKLTQTLEGRRQQLEANSKRIRQALEENAPDHVKAAGEEMISFLRDGGQSLESVHLAIAKLTEHLGREGRPVEKFRQHLKNIVKHTANRKLSNARISELINKHSVGFAELKENYDRSHEEYQTLLLAEKQFKQEVFELEDQVQIAFVAAVEKTLETFVFSLDNTIETIRNRWLLESQHQRQIYSRSDSGREMSNSQSKESFDVFLSHNSQDKQMVRRLADELQYRTIKVWLDERELRPGQFWQEEIDKVIRDVKAAAILVGSDGQGPWERPEMYACLTQCIRRGIPVIPVLLPGAPDIPTLPVFLAELTWVDLRFGMTPQALDKLVWGITGNK